MNFFSRIRDHRRAARPAPTQLRVEQLEDRCVPCVTPVCNPGAAHPGAGCSEQGCHSFVCLPGHDHEDDCHGPSHHTGDGGSCGTHHQHKHHHHGDGCGGHHGHPKPGIGSISGTVLDDTSGTPLAGVTVSLLDSQNKVVATATTNSSGVYTFSGLAVSPGAGTTYTVQQTTLSNYNLLTSPQTVTLTQASPQVQNVNFDNTQNTGIVPA